MADLRGIEWALGTLQSFSQSSLPGNISYMEEKLLEIKWKYDRSTIIKIKENIFK